MIPDLLDTMRRLNMVLVDRERYAQLLAIEEAARDWAAKRVEDGHLMGHSVIPSAQRLLDALDGDDS